MTTKSALRSLLLAVSDRWLISETTLRFELARVYAERDLARARDAEARRNLELLEQRPTAGELVDPQARIAELEAALALAELGPAGTVVEASEPPTAPVKIRKSRARGATAPEPAPEPPAPSAETRTVEPELPPPAEAAEGEPPLEKDSATEPPPGPREEFAPRVPARTPRLVPLLRRPVVAAPKTAPRSVPAIPVEQITSGTDQFFCVPYACKLTAQACVDRRARGREGLDVGRFSKCGGCELGAVVEQNSRVEVKLDIYRPKHGLPRVVGESVRRNGAPRGRRRTENGPTARVLEICAGEARSRAEIVEAGIDDAHLDTTLYRLRKSGLLTREGKPRAYRYRAT